MCHPERERESTGRRRTRRRKDFSTVSHFDSQNNQDGEEKEKDEVVDRSKQLFYDDVH